MNNASPVLKGKAATVSARISPDTGLAASSDNPRFIMEKFIDGELPKSEVYEGPNQTNPMTDGDKPLF